MSNDFPIIDPSQPRQGGTDGQLVATVFTHPIRRANEPTKRPGPRTGVLAVAGVACLVGATWAAIATDGVDPASLSCDDVASEAVDLSAGNEPATKLLHVTGLDIVEDRREDYSVPASGRETVLECVGNGTWGDDVESLVRLTLSVDTHGETHVDSEPIMLGNQGSAEDQDAAINDAIALGTFFEEAATRPADPAAAAALIESGSFTFASGNVLHDYRLLGEGPFIEFCVINTNSEAWALYRGVLGGVTDSGPKGRTCSPADKAPEAPPAA